MKEAKIGILTLSDRASAESMRIFQEMLLLQPYKNTSSHLGVAFIKS